MAIVGCMKKLRRGPELHKDRGYAWVVLAMSFLSHSVHLGFSLALLGKTWTRHYLYLKIHDTWYMKCVYMTFLILKNGVWIYLNYPVTHFFNFNLCHWYWKFVWDYIFVVVIIHLPFSSFSEMLQWHSLWLYTLLGSSMYMPSFTEKYCLVTVVFWL